MNQTLATVTVLLALLTISCKEKLYPDPLSPEKSLESFQLREGFKIELFAAEPDVADPVEMVFDEQGNAYVAEMPDYPFMPEDGKGAGRIKVLQDTDRDGRVDKTVIFADSILEATSMLPWKEGLIVAAAPHILYLKDTDGDFRADTKEVLFSGFFENNSEAQITSLRFGIDNWIYAANNGQAGTVHFRKKPDAPALNMSGADFRFRLDREQFEQESGGAQFGLTVDDWGNRFITQNTLHIRQPVIAWRYLNRHPHVPSPSATVINISDHELEMFQQTPPPYWRAERTRRRQIQYKEQNLDRVEYAEDHFTGCSGGTVYDGDAFPAEYYGNVFTGEVAGNLIHRDIIVPLEDRPTFVARRDDGEKTREFLASTDSWFRPSGFTVGPDGYLYVIDMYRQHIETPLSIPEDLKADMDFLAGSERGRIYRILPVNDGREKIAPDLRKMSSAELVQLLAHPNRWWRLQAQRLLLERQDASAAPLARDLFNSSDKANVRLHALYVLEGLNALDAAVVSQAMKDAHEGMRKHGLILAERYPELLPLILEKLKDPSVHVRFQAVLSAGGFTNTKITNELAKVLVTHGDDPLFRTAVLTARTAPFVDMLNVLIKQHSFLEKENSWTESFLQDLSYSIGSANEASEITALLDIVVSPNMQKQPQSQLAAINGLKKGLQRASGSDATRKEAIGAIKAENADQVNDAVRELRTFNESKRSI